MPLSENSPRVGRSQGTIIFWGLISVCFAAAACYYFWKNDENETKANRLRDENVVLQGQLDQLTAEKTKLQSSMSDAEGRLKAREDLLQEKENKLAEVESRLGTTAPKVSASGPATVPAPPPQLALLKKFSDAVHKLDQDAATEIIPHGGRSILRITNSLFFAPGEAALRPDGKVLLNQIAQSLKGEPDVLELRIESFTDSEAEIPRPAADAKPDAPKPRYANAWELTSARALTLSRFFKDQNSIPPENLLIIARGDSLPAATTGKDMRTRNRRVEIMLVSTAAGSDGQPLAPPPDSPAPATPKPN